MNRGDQKISRPGERKVPTSGGLKIPALYYLSHASSVSLTGCQELVSEPVFSSSYEKAGGGNQEGKMSLTLLDGHPAGATLHRQRPKAGGLRADTRLGSALAFHFGCLQKTRLVWPLGNPPALILPGARGETFSIPHSTYPHSEQLSSAPEAGWR